MKKWRWLQKLVGPMVVLGLVMGGVGAPQPARAAGDYYVTKGGSDGNDCSLANPCLTIARAVAKADADLASGATIHIGAGTYMEHDIAVTRALRFSGAGQDEVSGTIVDAAQAGRAFLISGVSSAVTFSGMRLVSGKPAGYNIDDSGSGGAIKTDSPLTLTQVTMADNLGYNGGALYTSGAVAIGDSQFISNTATAVYQEWFILGAGAVYASGDANIWDSQFISNTASSTGALYVGSAATIARSQFISNTAASDYAAVYVESGASVTDSVFRGNSGRYYGALGMWGPLVMTGTQFINNRGVETGALRVGQVANATITSSQFISNTAQGSIGALDVTGALTMTGTQFISNTAGNVGALQANSANIAGSLFVGNSAANNVGAVWVNGAAVITGSQFIRNTAGADYGALGAWYTLALTGTQFISNTAGRDNGALFANYPLVMRSSEFISNTAGRNGGVGTAKATTILDSRFERNRALGGEAGGMDLKGALVVSNSQFISNSAQTTSGVFYFPNFYSAPTSIQGSLFRGNQALTGIGGGLRSFGPLAITDTQFIANSATDYGALQQLGSQTVIRDSKFLSNTASVSIGAVGLHSSNLVMERTEFRGNHSGDTAGGLFAQYTATITDSLFSGNSTDGYGGGMYMHGKLTMENTRFLSNTAGLQAGALSIFQTYRWENGRIKNSLFANNQVTGGDGGALVAEKDVAITDTQFISNSASGSGGALVSNTALVLNGAEFLENTAGVSSGALEAQKEAAIRSSRFVGNLAGTKWGALHLDSGTSGVVISGTLLQDNLTPGDSGAGEIQGQSLAITNTRVLSNSAETLTGALHIKSLGARLVNAVFGGQARPLTLNPTPLGNVTVLHSTFAAAPAPATGSGVRVASGTVLVQDSILDGFATGLENITGTVTASYNLYYANTANRSGLMYSSHEMEGLDPVFANPAQGDLRLQEGTPALGAGVYNPVAPYDFLGVARANPPTIGAYEKSVPSSNANLESLELSDGTLSPAFTPQTLEYAAVVANQVTSMTVTPTAAGAHAAIHVRVNGGGIWSPVQSGQPSASLHLNVAVNVIEIRVTAADLSTHIYTLRVRRDWPKTFLPLTWVLLPLLGR